MTATHVLIQFSANLESYSEASGTPYFLRLSDDEAEALDKRLTDTGAVADALNSEDGNWLECWQLYKIGEVSTEIPKELEDALRKLEVK